MEGKDPALVVLSSCLVTAFSVFVLMFLLKPKAKKEASWVNKNFGKDCDKCVNFLTPTEIEDLLKDGKPKAFCRCWKSKTFPMCDGSHAAHNKETGDNTGPLVIKP
ncbi:hypothetical protein CYMTET_12833 [Cymbomonas tetramitiformis]|uniref:Iron-binding zinc finger CDGSH type domain-containing protein n=1 Tax=Cymbomonas tetramitiformis TaxID=36881 RepID=A0AAE0GJP1_9CHLO|nr:hypothetical protein CYMTET_12833 [Cymbomonas tetramitiformis]